MCMCVCVHVCAHKQCRLCTHNNRSINNSYVDTHPLLSPINSKICSINSVLHRQCSEYHQRVPLCSTVYSRQEVKNRFSVSILQVMFATSPIILQAVNVACNALRMSTGGFPRIPRRNFLIYYVQRTYAICDTHIGTYVCT